MFLGGLTGFNPHQYANENWIFRQPRNKQLPSKYFVEKLHGQPTDPANCVAVNDVLELPAKMKVHDLVHRAMDTLKETKTDIHNPVSFYDFFKLVSERMGALPVESCKLEQSEIDSIVSSWEKPAHKGGSAIIDFLPQKLTLTFTSDADFADRILSAQSSPERGLVMEILETEDLTHELLEENASFLRLMLVSLKGYHDTVRMLYVKDRENNEAPIVQPRRRPSYAKKPSQKSAAATPAKQYLDVLVSSEEASGSRPRPASVEADFTRARCSAESIPPSELARSSDTDLVQKIPKPARRDSGKLASEKPTSSGDHQANNSIQNAEVRPGRPVRQAAQDASGTWKSLKTSTRKRKRD